MTKTPDFFDFSLLSRDDIARLLNQFNIRLTVDEALTIQNDFLKRPPTYAECILWSIQGSEHCSYKSSRKHLKQFVTDGPHVILGPKEDAGIISVAADKQGKRYGIVMSHESHNHPSQLVPYEGAATGVGGNVRDVCCMGAEVIAVADSLRFGAIDRAKTKWIQEGVVRGIAGYANPLGIPNLAGDVAYDEGYNENCLVTLVTLGVVREDQIIHSYAPADAKDYVFILVGKPTDNSGFGGAAFASSTLDSEQENENKGAVQEPNAFLQRHILKANYAMFEQLRNDNLISHVGFKDLGAGGIACASVELADAAGFGAEIDLEKVPTSIPDLLPAVILCSETQERFMWVVPSSLADRFLQHYNVRFALPDICDGAQATIIGRLRSDDQYIVTHNEKTIVQAKAGDITQGILYSRPWEKKQREFDSSEITPPSDFNAALIQLLTHENIASREPVYETYDKQVQGRTWLERGEAAAGVLTPFNEDKYPVEIRKTGVALSVAQNPAYCKIDAYWGAVNAVVEAARNIVATGAWPVALTDCLCFGNPEKPEQMAELIDAIQGIVDASKAIPVIDYPQFSLPIISGNVSLYNESTRSSIPASPIISCAGAMPDAGKALTHFFQQAGSILIMVGARRDECGGSVYYQTQHKLGNRLPKPDLEKIGQEFIAVYQAIQQSLILSASAISRGGIAIALAQMSFRFGIGADVNLTDSLAADKLLFGETGGFILEVSPDALEAFLNLFAEYQVNPQVIGKTTQASCLKINSLINMAVEDARSAWTNGLRKRLLS